MSPLPRDPVRMPLHVGRKPMIEKATGLRKAGPRPKKAGRSRSEGGGAGSPNPLIEKDGLANTRNGSRSAGPAVPNLPHRLSVP